MRVLAISCITNTAAGLTRQEINHREVMEVGVGAGRRLAELLVRLIPRLVTIDPGYAGVPPA
jgi:purine-nucleoside phosphorylase